MKKANRIIIILLALALCLSAAACSGAEEPKETAVKEETVIPELNMEDLTCEIITTEPGEYVPVATTYIDIPEEFHDEAAHKGTFVREDYTTNYYTDGETLEKHLQVYLPYGYDENDTETKYNVLYYAHGNESSVDLFAKTNNRNMIDHIFTTGGIDPVIIVMITYYSGKSVDGNKTGTDGRYAGVAGDFYLEVVNDIIPLIETKYNTYLKGMEPTAENIIATRDHRGYSGYSRGGKSTWYMLRYALPYFRWYAPMSGACDGYGVVSLPTAYENSEFAAIHAQYEFKENGLAYPPYEDTLEFVKDGLEEFPGYDFYIYMTSGKENDQPRVVEQMDYFIGSGFFSYGDDPTVNNFYYAISNNDHNDWHSPANWFNTLRVLFH